MKKHILYTGIIAAVITIVACRRDNTEDLYATQTCDTTVTGYAAFVEPLIADRCLSCHSNANAGAVGGSIILEGYVNVVDYVNLGTLMSSVKHESANPMPKNEAKLDNCTINKLQKWVDNGAQNN